MPMTAMGSFSVPPPFPGVRSAFCFRCARTSPDRSRAGGTEPPFQVFIAIRLFEASGFVITNTTGSWQTNCSARTHQTTIWAPKPLNQLQRPKAGPNRQSSPNGSVMRVHLAQRVPGFGKESKPLKMILRHLPMAQWLPRMLLWILLMALWLMALWILPPSAAKPGVQPVQPQSMARSI